jgi:hypothetical protein
MMWVCGINPKLSLNLSQQQLDLDSASHRRLKTNSDTPRGRLGQRRWMHADSLKKKDLTVLLFWQYPRKEHCSLLITYFKVIDDSKAFLIRDK